MSRCQTGSLQTQTCSTGCLRPPPQPQAECLGTTPYSHSCTALTGTTKSTVGNYYVTAFGCWVDANGTAHNDPSDNCIPACLSQLKSQGICPSSDTGPDCERRLTWYTADADRFGCGNRVRITNPANGRSVVALVIDRGPNCSVENSVSFPVLDASGRVNRQLFNSDQGAVDRSLVHVVEVDRSTPLGP